MRPCLLVVLVIGTALGAVAQERPDAVAVSDSTLAAWLEGYPALPDAYSDRLSLAVVGVREPGRVRALGVSPDALLERLRGDLYGPPPSSREGEAGEPDVDVARSFQDYERDRFARADSLFEAALRNAPSDKARADYVHLRARRGFGGGGCSRALELFPMHAPCLYERLAELGREVGRPQTVEGRYAYLCLADRYRVFAASTYDRRLASAARRAADGYERAGRRAHGASGPPRPPAGTFVTVDLGAYGTCRTPVR